MVDKSMNLGETACSQTQVHCALDDDLGELLTPLLPHQENVSSSEGCSVEYKR